MYITGMKRAKKSIKAKPKTKKVVKKVSKKTNLETPFPSVGIMPLGDRVLVKPIEVKEERQTVSGIIIPSDGDKGAPEQGEVMAIGKKVETDLHTGDKVVFSRYGFEDIKVNGVQYYILKEENILAVIK